MQDSIQYPFIRNSFLSDRRHQLPAQPFVPVCIIKSSHNHAQDSSFRRGRDLLHSGKLLAGNQISIYLFSQFNHS